MSAHGRCGTPCTLSSESVTFVQGKNISTQLTAMVSRRQFSPDSCKMESCWLSVKPIPLATRCSVTSMVQFVGSQTLFPTTPAHRPS